MKMRIARCIRDIKTGVKNLIKWFPIIWNDRDYDQFYFYKILEFKMRNMRDDFNSTQLVDMKEEAAQLSKCVDALNRLAEENYVSSAIDNILSIKEIEQEQLENGNIKIHTVAEYNSQDNKDIDILHLSEIEDELINNDLKLVTETIYKNVRRWWW